MGAAVFLFSILFAVVFSHSWAIRAGDGWSVQRVLARDMVGSGGPLVFFGVASRLPRGDCGGCYKGLMG